jgi:hypothetical protein
MNVVDGKRTGRFYIVIRLTRHCEWPHDEPHMRWIGTDMHHRVENAQVCYTICSDRADQVGSLQARDGIHQVHPVKPIHRCDLLQGKYFGHSR